MTLFYYFNLVKMKHRLSQARITKRENGPIYGKQGTDQTSKQFTLKLFCWLVLGWLVSIISRLTTEWRESISDNG